MPGGIDSFTTLMLHCDGADASTTFTDSSLAPVTVTVNGDAQIDTAQSKFGGAAGLFDGTGDFLTISNTDGTVSAAQDFTIDCWVRLANIAASDVPWAFGSPTRPTLLLTTGSIALQIGGTSRLSASSVIAANTWYHIAVSRSSGDFRLFLDGVQIQTTYFDNGAFVPTTNFRIGISALGTKFQGWIDEFRFSKGIARWTAGFTPPTAAYTAGVDYTLSVSTASYAVTTNPVSFSVYDASPRRPLFRRGGNTYWRGTA